MQPGEVVRWVDFPLQKEGPQKPRWFLCLGKITFFGQESEFYLTTTTTKLEYYAPGGKRQGNPHFFMKKAQVPLFDADCIIDFALNRPEPFRESVILKHSGKMEAKGILPVQVMAELWSALVRARSVPAKVLQLLRESLESAGFKHLAKVK